DPSLKIEIISESDDPIVTTDESPLYRNLVAAITKAHPDAIVTPILVPYGTDSNAFRPRGVKSYGIFPAIVPPDAVASMHRAARRARRRPHAPPRARRRRLGRVPAARRGRLRPLPGDRAGRRGRVDAR